MSDRLPNHDDLLQYANPLGEERVLSWRQILAVAAVLGAIVCLNLYFLSDGIQRRVDYAYLRAQSTLKGLRPHDRYLPTPDTGSAEVSTALDPATDWAAPMQSPEVPAPSVRPLRPDARFWTHTPVPTSVGHTDSTSQHAQSHTQTAGAVPTVRVAPPPDSLPPIVLLETDCHEPQGWNNCGPATLAMALCFYGRSEDQVVVAAALKPDRNDKNVGPEEMVAYASSLDDVYAVMGYATDIGLLKRLLNAGLPVIVETWFIPEPDDEMGHYRLLTGYDDIARQFTTQDSYQGANQPLSYHELESLWKVFNRAYVIVAPAERAANVRALLGDEMNPRTAYQNTLAVAMAEIEADPEDRYAWFNAGTSFLGLGQVSEAAQAYDRARTLHLPWRLLWYQFGPFEAYLRAARYQDVIDLAEANLRTTKNLEESYYYRALARRALGDEMGARQDLETALRYNAHFQQASRALYE